MAKRTQVKGIRTPTNLFTYFRRFFVPNKDAAGNSTSNGMYPFSIGSLINLFPSVDARKAIDAGWAANATVNAIVSDTAAKFGYIPRYLIVDPLTSAVQKLRKGVPRRFHSLMQIKAQSPYASQLPNMNNKNIAALSELLNRPNKNQGQDQFFDNVKQMYDVTGETFIWCNRGLQVNKDFQFVDASGKVLLDDAIDKMPVLEMQVLPSTFMKHIIDPNDPFDILGWVWVWGGYEMSIRKQDIILWKRTNLIYDPVTRPQLRGFSPLQAGGAVLQASDAALRSTARMFQNNGAFGTLVYDDSNAPVAPGQMDQVRESVNSKINSGDYGGAIAVLAGEWNYLNFGKPETLPFLDGMQYTDRQLCMLFRYPYELINPNVTYENKEQAIKGWINNNIIPGCKQLDDEMNRVLLKAFGLRGVVCISSDYHLLPELQDDMNQLTQSLVQSWWLTPNQRLVAQGYDISPDPMMDEVFVPVGFTPMSQIGQDGQDQKTPLNDYEETDDVNDQ